MILYFTGTGNSTYVAEKIAEMTADSLISMTDKIRENSCENINAEKTLVFVTPTYGWRIPRIVEDWIMQVTFPENCRAYFVMTCGDGIGNAGAYLEKLCKKKGFEYMGCAEIVMPENYVAMFPVPEEDEALSIVRKADPTIRRAAERIRTGMPFPSVKPGIVGKMESGIINQAFYKFFVKADKFYAGDACNHCGRCTRVCPANNIRLVKGKPVWGKECTHCMACICGCPQKAIEYGKKSLGKPRYHCPL